MAPPARGAVAGRDPDTARSVASERADGFNTEIGVYVGLVGASIWAVGSFLLAREPEGDIEHVRRDDHRAGGTTGAAGTGTI